MKKRRAAKLIVVPGSMLGWSRPTDYFLLDKEECYGPFPDEQSARAASQRPRGSFGFGNVAPDLSFLFPQGTREPPTAPLRRELRPHST